MKPLQIWLPAFSTCVSSEAVRRDIERARQAWRQQACVWILPWFKEPFSWRKNLAHKGKVFRYRELGISGEGVNRLDVFHVGSNKVVSGSQWPARFHDFNIGSLLRDWLNYQADGKTIAWSPAQRHFDYVVPHKNEKNEIKLMMAQLERPPSGVRPLVNPIWIGDPDEEPEETRGKEIAYQWPPPGIDYQSIAPEAESKSIYRDLVLNEASSGPDEPPVTYVTSNSDPSLFAPAYICTWEPPFNLLLPDGGGLDAERALVLMANLARQSADEPQKALVEARKHAAPFLAEGRARRNEAWFGPKFGELGEAGVLTEIEGALGLAFTSLSEAFDSEELREKLAEDIEVTLCYGALGLLWALFLDRLGDGHALGSCERCGRIFDGRRDKRFCSKKDSTKCYRERKRKSKRRERRRRHSR